MKFLLPPGWKRPHGYSAGVAGAGTVVFVSGQIGWDGDEHFVSTDLAAQVKQALRNVVEVLGEAGGRPEHIARLTWYVVDREQYLANAEQIGAAYREVIGRHFPAMSVVEVSALVEPQAKVEIEATALVPPP